MINIATLCLLHLFDYTLAAIGTTATVAEEFIRLYMLAAQIELFRDLVDRYLLMGAEELTVVQLIKALVAEVLAVILAIDRGWLVAVLLTRLLALADVYCDTCLYLVE